MKKKILVADDDSSLRDIFQIILAKAGYDIELKEDANDIFKNNFKTPDLFLIDKLLSGVDGLEVCRYLKNNPSTSAIPVILISASPDIAAAATYAGADDFIEKPFESKYLLSVIEQNLNRVKTPELKKKKLSK